MTIALGLLCWDGLVLAADSMHTGETKRYAAKVAAHILKETKKHDPHVGGESRILMLSYEPKDRPEFVTADRISALESQLEDAKNITRELIVRTSVPGADVNAETAKHRREAVEQAIKAVRTIWLKAESGEVAANREMVDAFMKPYGIRRKDSAPKPDADR